MNILCISAANVQGNRKNSASLRACRLVEEVVPESMGINIETQSLIDYHPQPCIMCAKCEGNHYCVLDSAFNDIFSAMTAADAIVIVSPHYAPIPSKLMIILEKLEELAYLCYLTKRRFPLAGMPVALIAHGGQVGDTDEYYQKRVLEPLAATFRDLGMRIISGGEGFPTGAAFGVTAYAAQEGTVLPAMVHDWNEIGRRIRPLITNLLQALDDSDSTGQAASGV